MLNTSKIAASLAIIDHQLKVMGQAREVILMELESVSTLLLQKSETDPARGETMSQFHEKYLRKKNVCTYYLRQQPTADRPMYMPHCPYTTIGEMSILYFAQYVKHENLLNVRGYGQKIGEKIESAFSELGIHWMFGPSAP
jgi:hypothetical protein